MIILHFLEKAKTLSWDFLSMTQFKKQMTLHRNHRKAEVANFWSLVPRVLVLACKSTLFPSVPSMEILVPTPVADARQTVKLFFLPSFSAACCK